MRKTNKMSHKKMFILKCEIMVIFVLMFKCEFETEDNSQIQDQKKAS